MGSHNEDSGWQKIVRVHGQAFRSQDGRVEDAVVWIVTNRNEVFTASIPRGHNVKSIVRYYKERGWTDDKAIYFGPLTKKKYVRRKNRATRDPARLTGSQKASLHRLVNGFGPLSYREREAARKFHAMGLLKTNNIEDPSYVSLSAAGERALGT